MLLTDIPDDPFRVAPPHSAPGESEPEEIGVAEAVGDFIRVLRGQEMEAHGYDAQAIRELLLDKLLSSEDGDKLLVLAVLAPFSTEVRRFRLQAFRYCQQMANDFYE